MLEQATIRRFVGGPLSDLAELKRRYPGAIGGTIERDQFGRVTRMTPRYREARRRTHADRNAAYRRLSKGMDRTDRTARYAALEREMNNQTAPPTTPRRLPVPMAASRPRQR